MNIISLKEFIKTGCFGKIKIGSTKNEVIDFLGDNYDYGDFGYSKIIKYGWYEFFYYSENEKIYGIQNDHLQADCTNHNEMISLKNDRVILDTWFFKVGENITFKEVKGNLINENIIFNIHPLKENCNLENVIKCGSGVFFDFCSEYKILKYNRKGKIDGWQEIKEDIEENYILNGIRIFNI